MCVSESGSGTGSCVLPTTHHLKPAPIHPQVRPPMPPTHFFLIDVSYNAVHSGGLAAVCSAISRLLDELQGACTCMRVVGMMGVSWALA